MYFSASVNFAKCASIIVAEYRILNEIEFCNWCTI